MRDKSRLGKGKAAVPSGCFGNRTTSADVVVAGRAIGLT